MSKPTVAVEGYIKYEFELYYTVNGKAVTNFKVEDENLELHHIVAWESLAKACCQELDRNDKVMVIGYFEVRKWNDKEGNEKSRDQIVAKRVILLNTNPDSPKRIAREVGKNVSPWE